MHPRALVFILVLGLTAAGRADTLGSRLLSCASIEDPGARLACYDALAVDAGEAKVGPDELTPEAVTRGAEAAVPAAATPSQATDDRSRRERRARVAAVQKSQDGRLLVKLENGELWRQVRLERVRIAVDDDVLIQPGILGSHFFKLLESNQKVKFSRVQ